MFLEALISITSGMLLWMGFWDIVEVLLPPEWYWRLGMIVVGVVGLFATRTMYDKSMLALVRSRETRARVLRGRLSRHDQKTPSRLVSYRR